MSSRVPKEEGDLTLSGNVPPTANSRLSFPVSQSTQHPQTIASPPLRSFQGTLSRLPEDSGTPYASVNIKNVTLPSGGHSRLISGQNNTQDDSTGTAPCTETERPALRGEAPPSFEAAREPVAAATSPRATETPDALKCGLCGELFTGENTEDIWVKRGRHMKKRHATSKSPERQRHGRKGSGGSNYSNRDDLASEDDSLKLSYADFEIVRQWRAYFKKGRVFMTPWVDAAGRNSDAGRQGRLFVKVRRFVVVRPRSGHCLCLPIHTYSGRGTTKPGINPDDHAIIFDYKLRPKTVEGEKDLKKEPIGIIVENSELSVSASSRINFAKVQTVEYNVKVRTIGRVHPSCIELLETYFALSMGIKNPAVPGVKIGGVT